MGINLHVLNGLPIPMLDTESPIAARIVQIAALLAAVDERYEEWADEVGVRGSGR